MKMPTLKGLALAGGILMLALAAPTGAMAGGPGHGNHGYKHGNGYHQGYAYGHRQGRAYGHRQGRAYGHRQGRAYGHHQGRAYGHRQGRAYGHRGYRDGQAYGHRVNGRAYRHDDGGSVHKGRQIRAQGYHYDQNGDSVARYGKKAERRYVQNDDYTRQQGRRVGYVQKDGKVVRYGQRAAHGTRN